MARRVRITPKEMQANIKKEVEQWSKILSKPPKIKWKTEDVENLKKAVKRFNAKRSRLIKKQPSYETLIPKMSVRELRKEIETRRDLNFQLNSMKRFLEKGAEEIVVNPQGVHATRWEIRELRYATNRINAMRRSRLEKYKELNDGRLPWRIQDLETLMPKQFTPEQYNLSQFEKTKAGILRMSKSYYWREADERYKENYLKSFREEIGIDMDENLYKILQNIDASELVVLAKVDPELSIGFNYSVEEAQSKVSIIRTRLELYGYIKDESTA